MVWNKKIQAEMRRNRAIAVLLAGSTVFLGLSLLSYHPHDPSLNSFGLFPRVRNLCGFVGAVVSDMFYQLAGLAVWLFVPAGLWLAFRFFVSRFRESVWVSWLFFMLFLLSLTGLLELHFSKVRFFEGQVSLGGVFGKSFVALLYPRLDFAGTAVVIWSVFLTALLSRNEISLSSLWRSAKAFLAKTLQWAKKTPQGARFVLQKTAWLISRSWGFLRLWAKALSALIKKGLLKIQEISIFNPQGPPPESLDTIGKSSPFEEKQALPHSKKERARLAPADPLSQSAPATKAPEFAETPDREGGADGARAKALEMAENPPQQKDPYLFENSPPKEPAESDPALNTRQDLAPSAWDLPSWNLLSPPSDKNKDIDSHDVEDLSKKLISKLSQFSIKGEIKAIRTGPAVILFEFKPEEHIKVSRIKEMAGDLSLALSSESVRIIAPIPGRDVVGIEASRPHREMVWLKELLMEKDFFKAALPLVLGRRADNQIGIRDLVRIPHMLVAGTTGSGKSIFVISFIAGLLFRHTPENLRLILVDPKQVDLSGFNDIPHLLAPVVTSSHKAAGALQWAVKEMEKRYRSLSVFGVRDQLSFNKKIKTMSLKDKKNHEEALLRAPPESSYYCKSLPLIVIVIEEFGDLMADKNIRRSIENAVVRLAQKARACGIHLVLAMQSPRKDVVTGLIKTNIPGRISFKVASGTDSRVILDETGAERLLSHGDMLFLEPGSSKPSRYHGPYIREKDVLKTVEHWKRQAPPLYEESLAGAAPQSAHTKALPLGDDIKTDPMYDEILSFVQTCNVISASFLQRKFRIGYPRAGRIIEILYEEGKIGPPQGSKPREVLINRK